MTDQVFSGVIHAGIQAGDLIGGPQTMAGLLASSLDDCQRFDPRDVLGRYVGWWKTDGFDTGPIAGTVFRLITEGVPPQAAVAKAHKLNGNLSAGCNPLHRNLVLAEASFLTLEDATLAAFAESELTHKDRLAGEASAMAVRVARCLLEGKGWQDALDLSLADLDWSDRIRTAVSDCQQPPVERSGFAPSVLQAAMHFVGCSTCPGEVLRRTVEFSGPANYVPVLACGLAAARWPSSR